MILPMMDCLVEMGSSLGTGRKQKRSIRLSILRHLLGLLTVMNEEVLLLVINSCSSILIFIIDFDQK